jgi:hypothetical protein
LGSSLTIERRLAGVTLIQSLSITPRFQAAGQATGLRLRSGKTPLLFYFYEWKV